MSSRTVDFRVANVIRHLPKSQFDLVWAAGLFDYFRDQLLTFMIRRLHNCVKPNGTLLVGNFSRRNPTRAYMEFGGWMLFHRTEEETIALTRQAVIRADQSHVAAESEGVNPFF